MFAAEVTLLTVLIKFEYTVGGRGHHINSIHTWDVYWNSSYTAVKKFFMVSSDLAILLHVTKPKSVTQLLQCWRKYHRRINSFSIQIYYYRHLVTILTKQEFLKYKCTLFSVWYSTVSKHGWIYGFFYCTNREEYSTVNLDFSDLTTTIRLSRHPATKRCASYKIYRQSDSIVSVRGKVIGHNISLHSIMM